MFWEEITTADTSVSVPVMVISFWDAGAERMILVYSNFEVSVIAKVCKWDVCLLRDEYGNYVR